MKMKPVFPGPQTFVSSALALPALHCRGLRVSSSSPRHESIGETTTISYPLYRSGIFDDFFLSSFRSKLAQEVGWDSEKPGYDGMIELAKALMMKSKKKSDASEAAVRILNSFFPPFLLDLFKSLMAPINGGKVASSMVANVTVLTCQWLMGSCTVNSVDLPDGSSWESGVLVERCKYLEESKCVGVCVNTCKIPTQTFFKENMGVPLLMEPNFIDYSCQFKFGILPPLPEEDAALQELCLETCSIVNRREISSNMNVAKCPNI